MNHRRLMVAALLAIVAVAPACGAADDPAMLAAGGGRHVFLAIADDAGQWQLVHHDTIDDALSPLRALAQPPLALAAHEREVWLVSAAGAGASREVFGLELRPGPSGMLQPFPRDRLRKLPALPGSGVLAGFGIDAGQPVALLVPAPMAAGDATGPRLLGLARDGWEERQPPPLAPGASVQTLSAWGAAVEGLVVLEVPRSQLRAREHSTAYWSSASTWTESRLAIDARSVRAATTGWGGWPAFVVQSGPDLVFATVEPRRGADAWHEVARMPVPTIPWAVVGSPGGGRIRMYSGASADRIEVRTIGAASGVVSAAVPLQPRTTALGERWRGPLLIAVAAFALVMAMLLRPGQDAGSVVPAGCRAASPGARLVALVIDLIPGAALALIVTGASPGDLLILPLTTTRFSDATPWMCAALGAVLIGVVGEATRGTTPGKALLGLRVESCDGRPLRFGQVLLRAVVRIPVLLAPMLGVFVLINPNGQGLPDLLARVVVVGRDDADETAA